MDGMNCSSALGINISDCNTTYSLRVVLGDVFFIYVLPIIIFVGIFGNGLSFIVFLDRELRNISSSVYIMAVLITDTGTLVTLIIVWLEALRINPWYLHGMCKAFVYITYIFNFLSEWYVVCITVENYVTLRHPTKIKIFCTVRNAVIVTVSLAIFAFSFYCVFLFLTHSSAGSCLQWTNDSEERIFYVFFYIDQIITLLLPTIVLFVLLAIIVLQVLKSIKSKRRMSQKFNKKQSSIPQVRVAKMLFVLSTSSFLQSTPDHVLKFCSSMGQIVSLSESEQVAALILNFLAYTKFSSKFFILVGFSKNFRQKILKKLNYRKPRYEAVEHTEISTMHHVSTNTSPSN